VASNGIADLAFMGGDVYTVDAARSWAGSVAVRDGRIVAVGSEADVRERIGPGTEIVDLAGGMLLPGFQDAHVHPVSGGIDRLQCALHGLSTRRQYLDAIATYAAEHPDEPWILGGGWSQDAFPRGCPDRADLDAIVPDRPVFLPNRDGHGAWVNSRALELAGITRDTPDPIDGRIERGADGEPQGTLHEGAMTPVSVLQPPIAPPQVLAALLQGQAYLHSVGVTGWQDAIVDRERDGGNLDAYVTAGADGTLTGRVVGALRWDRTRGLEQIDDLVAMRAEGRAGRFAATSVKIMQDGICENFTAAVLEPYLDAEGRPTENRGISFVDPDLLREAVTRLDALGFQVHFHALAERAVREALDAVEAARRANGPNDLRHHLAHIQVVHPDDLPRFRALGAVANAQPLWAYHDPQMDRLTVPFLGEPRSSWQYPFASLRRHGAVLAMGSDWPVSSADPLQEIHVAVNRLGPPGDPSGSAEPFLPEERLDLAAAIAGFTIGSAYVNHRDHETGSIEVGKAADLVLVDRNLFAHPVEEIGHARSVQAFVAGDRVYTAT
jgi:predicted amidohydrolase YtcJ